MRSLNKIALLLAPLCSGCADLHSGAALPLNKTLRTTEARNVAFVGVSATNVVEFYKIANAFQEVQFKPTADTLLADAVQTTSSANAQYADALAASISATLAGTAIDRTKTVATDSQGVATSTSNNTAARKTPDAPNTFNFTVTPPNATADPSGQAVGTEAQLKYQVAKSLAEEIAMLNNQVANIAHRSGYRPYLVSIQLTVQPYDHGYPYDTYLDLTFNAVDKTRNVIVLPLIISDALENTRQSQTASIVRQLGADLKASGGFVGASASLQRTLSRLDETLSLRPNSLLSIAKASDNALKVRLGASAMGETYEMIPRTHIVSFVLLVPQEMANLGSGTNREVTVATRVEYRDALSNVYTGSPEVDLVYPLPTTETIEIPQHLQPLCPLLQSAPLTQGTLNDLPIQVALLNGGRDLDGHPLQAELSFSGKDKTAPLTVAAEDIRPTDFGLRIAFPDLSRFLPAKGVSTGKILLHIFSTGAEGSNDVCPIYAALYAPPPAPEVATVKKTVVKSDAKGVAATAAEATTATTTSSSQQPLALKVLAAPVTAPQ